MKLRNYYWLFLKISFIFLNFHSNSIGIILFRRKQFDVFLQVVDDLILNSEINLVGLVPLKLKKLVDVSKRFNLDFDDAYQYVVAEHYGLSIVSFDSDFDRTYKGRTTPAALLK